jgi:hypothetical protein
MFYLYIVLSSDAVGIRCYIMFNDMLIVNDLVRMSRSWPFRKALFQHMLGGIEQNIQNPVRTVGIAAEIRTSLFGYKVKSLPVENAYKDNRNKQTTNTDKKK